MFNALAFCVVLICVVFVTVYKKKLCLQPSVCLIPNMGHGSFKLPSSFLELLVSPLGPVKYPTFTSCLTSHPTVP